MLRHHGFVEVLHTSTYTFWRPGSFSRGVKRRHYEIARGSATECIAVLDLAVALGVVAEASEARHLFARAAVCAVSVTASRSGAGSGSGVGLGFGIRARKAGFQIGITTVIFRGLL